MDQEDKTRVGPDYLEELLEHILDVVPKKSIHETPIFLLATAGMRLLPHDEQTALLDNICSYMQSNSDLYLPDCSRSVLIIDGPTEGLYGWLATNYLLGSFDDIDHPNTSSEHHTYGFLDMGGASAQIAFAPTPEEAEKHANDLTLLRLRTVDGASIEHKLFTTSWLGYGVHQARDRYLDTLLHNLPEESTATELRDPCLPSGFSEEHRDIKVPSNSTQAEPLHIVGTGDYDECLRLTYPLLEKNVPCPDEPCLVHGMHVPSIDFNINHFIGISEWWHTTHQVFGMSHEDERYDFNEYQKSLQKFCSTPWYEIKQGVEEHRYGKKVDFEEASEICFKASWMVNLLHEGIGVPRVGLDDGNSTSTAAHHKGRPDPFQALDKIGSTEISWTLGKAVLVASSDVPATGEALPVGFGSNVPGIPGDFQFPGPTALGNQTAEPQEQHWHDRLFDVESPRRIPGFLLFVLIILIAMFYLLGKDRRRRLLKVCTGSENRAASRPGPGRGFFGGKMLPFLRTSSPYPEYERVLEEGIQDFELSEVHSNRQAAPSSHRSRPRVASPPRPSSNGSTESNHIHHHTPNDTSARSSLSSTPSHGPRGDIDRRGMAIKTESSDHVPSTLSIGSTNTGRKSRAASPIRRASSQSPR
ncbi:U2 snRNP complex subunit [Ascosphaera pollenicola]|nr:U2 snRNP complex subunit [Ascosphaera pollenicola]